jgi:hypothetical protein
MSSTRERPDRGGLVAAEKVHERIVVTQLSLVIEASGPATARFDRVTERRLHQETKVSLYCVIDLEAKRAEVWTRDATSPVIEKGVLSWRPV